MAHNNEEVSSFIFIDFYTQATKEVLVTREGLINFVFSTGSKVAKTISPKRFSKVEVGGRKSTQGSNKKTKHS